MSFLSFKILQENSLYTNQAERDSLVKDKKKLMDAFLVNYFGFLGLYAISDKRGAMQHYASEEGKLQHSSINDTNKDVSLVVKLAIDAGLVKTTTATLMTKLLSLIKQKQLKSADIDSAKIREFVDGILLAANPPSPMIKQAFEDFKDGKSDLPHLAKSFFEIVRTRNDFKPITVEFRALANIYRPYFDQLPDAVAHIPGATPHPHAANSLANRVKKKDKLAGTQTSASAVPVNTQATSTVNQAVAAGNVKVKKVKAPPAPTVPQGITKDLFKALLTEKDGSKLEDILKLHGVKKSDQNLPQELNSWLISFEMKFKAGQPTEAPPYIKDIDLSQISVSAAGRVLLGRSSKIRTGINGLIRGWGAAYIEGYGLEKFLLDLSTIVFDGHKIIDVASALEGHGILARKFLVDKIEAEVSAGKDYEHIIASFKPYLRPVMRLNGGAKIRVDLTSPKPVGMWDCIVSTFPRALVFDGSYWDETPFQRLKVPNIDIESNFLNNSFMKEVTKFKVRKFDTLPQETKDVLVLLKDRLAPINEKDVKEELFDALFRTTTPDQVTTQINRFSSEIAKGTFDESIWMDVWTMVVKKGLDLVPDQKWGSSGGLEYFKEHIKKDVLMELVRPEFESMLKETNRIITDKKLVSFMRLIAGTSNVTIIHDIINPVTQDLLLHFYCNNSGFVQSTMSTLAEALGQSYSPNQNLVDNAWKYSKKIHWKLFDESSTEQVHSQEFVDSLFDNFNNTPSGLLFNLKSVMTDMDGFRDSYIKFYKEVGKKDPNFTQKVLDVLRNFDQDVNFGVITADTYPLYFRSNDLFRLIPEIPKDLEAKIKSWVEDHVGNKNNQLRFGRDNAIEDIIAAGVLAGFKNPNNKMDKQSKLRLGNSIPEVAKVVLESITATEALNMLEQDKNRNWTPENFNLVLGAIKEASGKFIPKNVGTLANTMFGFARKNKKSFKKVFRDEFAEEVMKVLVDNVEDPIAQKAYEEIEDSLLKKRFLEQYVSVEIATTAQEELNKRDAEIFPVKTLSKSQTLVVLRLNDVEPKIDRKLFKTTDLKRLKTQAIDLAKKEGFQKLAVVNTNKSQDELIAESIRLDGYNRHAHGETSFLIKKMFDVAVPRQVAGFAQWKLEHPNANSMLQFHGTSSLPAAMILRYGFTVVDESSARAAGIKYAGKMLGDGVYCSNVIDKVGQYLGEAGMTRRFGTTGYIFEMDALTDTWGRKVAKRSPNDYASAGTGKMGEAYSTVSPEWAMRDAEQFRIHRCYFVEIISKSKMKELKENHLKESFNFDKFMKEAREEKVNMKKITYTFVDGTVPISETEAVQFDEIDWKKYPAATLDFNRQGVVVQFDCPNNAEEFHETVVWTREFMYDRHKAERDVFLKLLKGKK